MRPLLKILAAAVLLVALAPICAMAAFDLLVFQPQAAQVRTIVARSAPAELNPPPSLVRVIRAANINVGAQASRLLMHELQISPSNGGMLGWHTASVAWWLCASLHLTEQERLAALLSLSPMGGQVAGFSAASLAIFGIPLASVSVEQAAGLLVIAKSPSRYLANPDLLARHSTALSQRVGREL